MSRKVVGMLFSLALPIGLSGCASVATKPEALPTESAVIAAESGVIASIPQTAAVLEESAPPPFHVWSYLESHGQEPDNYGMYSYVLAGRDRSDESHAQRYEALITAIKGSTPGTGDMPSSIPTRKLNVFLIPAQANTDAWNIGLSLAMATILTASDARFANPGPFIVTLSQPVSFSGAPEATMLFVDLTHTHPDAMSEVVNVYKQHVSSSQLQGVEHLESIKLKLLNALLIADERIGFAKTAYVDLQAAFFPH